MLPGVAEAVARRLADGVAASDAAMAEAFAFAAADHGGGWAGRVRPPGTELLAGHPARGTVLELTGPDRPLVVTSLEEELRGRGARVAQISPLAYGARRTDDGVLREVGPARGAARPEALVQVELEDPVPAAAADELLAALLDVLGLVGLVTGDHDAIRARLAPLAGADGPPSEDGGDDARTTIRWLLDGNALLLGLARRTPGGEVPPPDAAAPDLGLARAPGALDLPPPGGRAGPPDPTAPLRVTRLGRTSPVHRRVPMLVADVLAEAPGGDLVVERLLWVAARRAAGAPLSSVPLLRRKLDALLEREDVVPGSYDEQHLTLLFQSLPEDDLFGLDEDELHTLVRELHAQDRDHGVRVVLRPAEHSHAVAALVTVPVERWTRTLRERLERFLRAQLDGTRVDVGLSIGGGSSAVTARFLVHVDPAMDVPDELAAVAREVRLLCRSWEEQLASALTGDVTGSGALGEADAAAVAARWAAALPEAYRDAVAPVDAVADVRQLDALAAEDAVERRGARVCAWFGRGRAGDGSDRMVLVTDHPLELSRLVPVLESLDLWVGDEARWSAGSGLHLHHLGVRARRAPGREDQPPPSVLVPAVGARVAQAVVALLTGQTDRDGLNRLVLHAGLPWPDVAVLRTYRRYRHQVNGRDEQSYVDEVLVRHPAVARGLAALWHARFPPEGATAGREAAAAAASAAVRRACDGLARLDHDRILRGLAGTIDATLRTNLHLRPEGPLALKLDPSSVPDTPLPRPHREVFVSGRGVEGVHLRAGPVAAGGCGPATGRRTTAPRSSA